ncbi:MAG: PadR family transcriptional regulator [Pseudomonadota bacterium]
MSLRHAILALLDVEPGTGYDLMTRFRRSVGFFWHASHQQVYKELHGLLDEEMVDCEEIAQSGKPARKVYTLNAHGAAELDDWITQGAAPLKIRDPLLVKLFAGRRLSPERLAGELAAHRARHRQTLVTYRELEAMIDAMPARKQERYRYPRQTLRMGIHFEEGWLAWCDETFRTLSLPETADPVLAAAAFRRGPVAPAPRPGRTGKKSADKQI